jgi:hypothetical protein
MAAPSTPQMGTAVKVRISVRSALNVTSSRGLALFLQAGRQAGNSLHLAANLSRLSAFPSHLAGASGKQHPFSRSGRGDFPSRTLHRPILTAPSASTPSAGPPSAGQSVLSRWRGQLRHAPCSRQNPWQGAPGHRGEQVVTARPLPDSGPLLLDVGMGDARECTKVLWATSTLLELMIFSGRLGKRMPRTPNT